MAFNSWQYYLFLPIVILVTYMLPPKGRKLWLLAVSYFFYMCWQPAYALLILFSTFVTYAAALALERGREDIQSVSRKKLIVGVAVVANLSVLAVFKYFNFFSGLLEDFLAALGLAFAAPVLDILLPVGISFYIFQAVGYIIDVYRGRIKAEHDFVVYALFVSFFPQLVAGPIERSGNLLPQLRKGSGFGLERFQQGLPLIFWGLFKKIVIADRLAVLANTAYSDVNSYIGWQLIVATMAFTMQIYCDFSAYSDIARGSAKLLNIDLMVNFRQPYFSCSLREFWQRWHISLSTWFKDYLYIPLGGSRHGTWRTCLNLLVIFTVSGLWHGAALTYVFWGGLHGLWLVGGRVTASWRNKLRCWLHIDDDKPVWPLVQMALTFGFVFITWVFFRSATIADSFTVLANMFDANMLSASFNLHSLVELGLSVKQLFVGFLAVILLFAGDLLMARYPYVLAAAEKLPALRYGFCLMMLLITVIFGYYGAGYDAQNFIYFQF